MKKNFLIIICLLFVSTLTTVKAETMSISITCDKTNLVAGESTKCNITGNISGDSVSGISGTLSVDNGLTFSSFAQDSSWQGTFEDNKFDLYTDTNKNNTFNIGTFVLGAAANANGVLNIKLSGIGYSLASFTDKSANDVSKAITILSNNNDLNSITVSDTTLSPAFNKTINSYTAIVDSSKTKVTIAATASDSNAVVSGDIGEKSLRYGTNSFKINVKSAAGNTKVYYVSITRKDDRSTDGTLKSLSLNGNVIELSNNVFEYKYDVESNVDKLNIVAVINDSKASFVDEFGAREVSLNNGENKILVKVKAENESISTYTLVVNRKTKNNESSKDKNLSGNTVGNNNSNDNYTSNPKTGSSSLYIVIGILLISIISVCVVLFLKYKKNGVGVQNEK